MNNVILIGMPAAGKSTIGVLLAKAVGLTFTDTDIVIQEKERRLLQDILDKDGIEEFISIEEKIILSLDLNHHVVATGGSVVYSDTAMKHLKESGKVIYLHLEYQEIEERLKNIKTRGVVLREGQSLMDLYEERKTLYARYADIVIYCTGKELEEVVTEIAALVDTNNISYR